MWKKGTIGNYQYIAEVYDNPSVNGIDEGRISKLDLTNLETGEIEVSYDRGWVQSPTLPEHIKIVEEVKSMFSGVMPKRSEMKLSDKIGFFENFYDDFNMIFGKERVSENQLTEMILAAARDQLDNEEVVFEFARKGKSRQYKFLLLPLNIDDEWVLMLRYRF